MKMKNSTVIPFSLQLHGMLKPLRRHVNSRGLQFVCKFGANSCPRESTDHATVGGDALLLEQEDVLHADNVLFHARDFAEMRNSAAAIAHTGYLNHNGNCRCDLTANSLFRQIQVCHQRHSFHSGDCIPWAVSVNGGQRPIMASV